MNAQITDTTALPLRHARMKLQLSNAISQTEAAGQHHRAVPIRAMCRGRITHMAIRRDTPDRHVETFFAKARRPELVLVADDDGCPTGPSGWGQAARLLAWARYVLIHASSGRGDAYHAAMSIAVLTGRFVLIETSTDFAEAWRAAAIAAQPAIRIGMIRPRNGEHPAQLARERTQ